MKLHLIVTIVTNSSHYTENNFALNYLQYKTEKHNLSSLSSTTPIVHCVSNMILFLKHTIETSFDFSQFLMLFLKNSSERNNASNSFESVRN